MRSATPRPARVTLATFPTGGQMFLPELLARVDELDGPHPARAPTATRHPTASLPLTADFDIVLAHGMQLPKSTADTIVVPVMTEPLDIALPSIHRLADREYLVPKDLVGERWIGNPWGYPFEAWLNQIPGDPRGADERRAAVRRHAHHRGAGGGRRRDRGAPPVHGRELVPRAHRAEAPARGRKQPAASSS